MTNDPRVRRNFFWLFYYHRWLFCGQIAAAALAIAAAIVFQSLIAALVAGWLFRSVLVYRRPEEHPDLPVLRDILSSLDEYL